MSTKSISEYHASKLIFDTWYEVNIPIHHINAVMNKVAQLATELDWAPFRADLMRHYARLNCLAVCGKTDIEFRELYPLSLPRELSQQLHDLLQMPCLELRQKVAEMLENSDWAPWYAKLRCLKIRVDEITKKEFVADIERVGIANLIANITSFSSKSKRVCSKPIRHELLRGDVCKMQQHIKDNPAIVSSRFSPQSSQAPLSYACTHSDISARIPFANLMIQAGADVNRFTANEASDKAYPPLCEAFSGGSFNVSHTNDLKVRQELLQMLLDAGADPNLPTRPAAFYGFSTVIYDIISVTEQYADELLPTLVDAGMDIDRLQICTFGDVDDVVVATPLMEAIRHCCIRYFREGDGTLESERIHKRLEFVRALIFSNAIVHNAARKQAEENGCLEQLDRWVGIREAVIKKLIAPLQHFLLSPIVDMVSRYWTPNIPELRASCYALEQVPIIREAPLVPANSCCTIC